MSTPHNPELADQKRLSSEVLDHARRGDWPQAAATTRDLQQRHGDRGMSVLLLGLADTVICGQGGHSSTDEALQPAWVDLNTGRLTTNADQIVPRVRWAGRFIAARARQDEAMCRALVQSCSTDEEYRDCVIGLIETTADTMNSILGAP